MLVNKARPSREVCQRNGIAVTHQRQVLNAVMKTMHGHPGPEEVDAQVKDEGAGYLAGYHSQKHTFIYGKPRLPRTEYGLCSLGLEMNDESHDHMACSKCRAVNDIREKSLGCVEARQTAWVDFWCSGIGIRAKRQQA
jgi:Fur family peroxide stress response transcriptional regulator